MNKTLFVFYTANPNSETKSWSYGKFPKGWVWIGGGTTVPINSKKVLKYVQEEQFDGPANNIDKMKEYLDKYFTELKEKKIIKVYKIRKSFKP
jgi:hypothetical protein